MSFGDKWDILMAMTRDIRDKQNAQEKHYMHIVYLYIKIIFFIYKKT